MKEIFTFPSSDGKTTIHAVRHMPENGEIKAILQIVHGMVEFVERYDAFAKFLTEHGYMVVGHDHLGHGDSVTDKSEWGYFGEPDPLSLLLTDIHTLRTMTQEQYPDVPYFMLGHSMGSYLLRSYLSQYNDNLRGAIIMGTGYIPEKTTNMGFKVVNFLAKIHNWHYVSKFVAKLSFDKPYKRYDLTGKDATNSWLTKDPEIVKWYYSEPKCTYMFTINGYKGLFQAVQCSCNFENIKKVPNKLPLFIVSGQDDPVGNNGIGVKKVYDLFAQGGSLDLTYKLYPNDRHEILNETDKEEVYADLLSWMNVRITT